MLGAISSFAQQSLVMDLSQSYSSGVYALRMLDRMLPSQIRDAEMVRAVWLAFGIWLTKPPRGDPGVFRWHARCQSLAGLRHVRRLSFVFAPVLQRLAHIATSFAGNWTTVIKPWSHCGYDYRRRVIDYGNYQYKTIITAWAWFNVDVENAMLQLSTVWPTCTSRYADSWDALNHQGDLVEVCLSLCRGDDAFDLLSLYDRDSWRSAYADLCSLCDAVDHLYCYMREGCQARSTHRAPVLPHEPSCSEPHWEQLELDGGFASGYCELGA